jgi:hypothetical protein
MKSPLMKSYSSSPPTVHAVAGMNEMGAATNLAPQERRQRDTKMGKNHVEPEIIHGF